MRSTGSRMAARFFGYFLCARKESDKPIHRGKVTWPAKRPAPPNPLFAGSLQVAKIQLPQRRVLPRGDPGHAQHRK
ncbi:hypothetical protein, partial [Pseudomonas juntendi]|uniref:hypothetical protein n=1 Tax=Pseudomonas juntendi TaxID=2666183 RepID=UPI003451E294